MENMRNPVAIGLNIAIAHLCSITCPRGYHTVETFNEAPTTLLGVVKYANEHGVLCIATEDSDGTIYDSPGINHDLRAWHDSVHFRHGFQFNAAGEAAAAYVQVAQMAAIYGDNPDTAYWAALLLTDLLGLVHYHQRTELWPTDKRKFVMERVDEWALEAGKLVTLCAQAGTRHEDTAIARSRGKWGNPYALS